MTAIGFFLFVLGFMIVRIWGMPFPASVLGQTNKADVVGLLMMAAGFLLGLAGIAQWLWRVMP